MNINDFIDNYCTMIIRPVIINKMVGFELSNGFKIFFKDTGLTHKNFVRLRKHYREIKE